MPPSPRLRIRPKKTNHRFQAGDLGTVVFRHAGNEHVSGLTLFSQPHGGITSRKLTDQESVRVKVIRRPAVLRLAPQKRASGKSIITSANPTSGDQYRNVSRGTSFQNIDRRVR
jgi:hypothetical protein